MNNENSNNDLNSISLGSIDNLGSPSNDSGIDTLNGPIAPINGLEEQAAVPPVNPIPDIAQANSDIINPVPLVDNQTSETNPEASSSMPANNSAIVTNNVPPVEPIPPVEPVAPIYDVAETINNFNSAPVFNDIGTVPPIPNVPVIEQPIIAEPSPNNDNKKKKGTDKLLFVIIIILVLTAVGIGVYIFLGLSNGVTKGVNVKNVKIEVGSDISTDITDYASFIGINSSTCELDTSQITSTTVLNAEYPFTIKCNDKSYYGSVLIVDTIAPLVELKEVTIGTNETIKAEDFIASCTDKTACTYEFKDENLVNSYLGNTGNYSVDIIVKDESGNTNEVTASLVIDGATANLYLICSKDTNEYVESTKLGIDSDNNFIKIATRIYTFTLNETNYMEFKNDNSGKTEVVYNGISGTYTLDDANRSVSISKQLSYDELTTEAGSEIPLEYSELKTFYQNKGYTCRTGS